VVLALPALINKKGRAAIRKTGGKEFDPLSIAHTSNNLSSRSRLTDVE
jgi:hypothetical protein